MTRPVFDEHGVRREPSSAEQLEIIRRVLHRDDKPPQGQDTADPDDK